jgi:hypothetical protein
MSTIPMPPNFYRAKEHRAARLAAREAKSPPPPRICRCGKTIEPRYAVSELCDSCAEQLWEPTDTPTYAPIACGELKTLLHYARSDDDDDDDGFLLPPNETATIVSAPAAKIRTADMTGLDRGALVEYLLPYIRLCVADRFSRNRGWSSASDDAVQATALHLLSVKSLIHSAEYISVVIDNAISTFFRSSANKPSRGVQLAIDRAAPSFDRIAESEELAACYSPDEKPIDGRWTRIDAEIVKLHGAGHNLGEIAKRCRIRHAEVSARLDAITRLYCERNSLPIPAGRHLPRSSKEIKREYKADRIERTKSA